MQTRIIAKGIADLVVAGGGDASGVDEAFRSFIDCMFPHLKSDQAAKDSEMKAALKKEVAKGVLTFKRAPDSILQRRAKELSLPDDFRQKLKDRRKGKA